MKIELTLNEISTLAADELFLAKQWLKDWLFWKEQDGKNLHCEMARKYMLESFKMWRKLTSDFIKGV